jgi:hypothetical protein
MCCFTAIRVLKVFLWVCTTECRLPLGTHNEIILLQRYNLGVGAMPSHVIVWGLETVLDPQGFAAAPIAKNPDKKKPDLTAGLLYDALILLVRYYFDAVFFGTSSSKGLNATLVRSA